MGFDVVDVGRTTIPVGMGALSGAIAGIAWGLLLARWRRRMEQESEPAQPGPFRGRRFTPSPWPAWLVFGAFGAVAGALATAVVGSARFGGVAGAAVPAAIALAMRIRHS